MIEKFACVEIHVLASYVTYKNLYHCIFLGFSQMVFLENINIVCRMMESKHNYYCQSI